MYASLDSLYVWCLKMGPSWGGLPQRLAGGWKYLQDPSCSDAIVGELRGLFLE
jgi:hypothetical protein